MFITELFESRASKILVTYPGRFQPFHMGHKEVFDKLSAQFGRDSVYIVTSNKTNASDSPFNFSDKVQLMTAAGVPADRIIEVSNTYNIPPQFESQKNELIFITAVGAPDAKRLAPDTTKKDGNPSYFKSWQGFDSAVTADQHGYVVVMPEEQKSIKIGNQTFDVSHGTDNRNLWKSISRNAKKRTEYLVQMYGRADPSIAKILDKILSLPESTNVDVNIHSKQMLRRARIAHPLAKSDEEAMVLYIADKEERDNRHEEDEIRDLTQRVGNLEHELLKVKGLKWLLNKPNW